MPLVADKKPSSKPAGQPQPNVVPIIKQVLAGNRDAFEEIVFLYRDQVYATCRQLTRNNEDAMDVAQDVFVRVYRSLSSFKGNARFSTWLHRIILNTSVDYIRREKKHNKNRVMDAAEDDSAMRPDRRATEGSSRETQRSAVLQGELNQQIMGAVAQLSSRQRDVFLLRYYQDLSLKEISEVLRCSEGSVKRHLFRAQSRLRELLKDIERK